MKMSRILPMDAVVLKGPRDAVIERVPRPDAGPLEVVVKVEACGFCGTDLKIFEGEYLSPYPLIPGHEISGLIVSVGSNVEQSLLGTRVSVDPTLSCGTCEYCLRAEFNHCESWGAIGDTVNGGFAEYVAVPARNIYALDSSVSYITGALTEPLACAVWALQRMPIAPATEALIFGAGPMGIILSTLLLKHGVMDLVIVDKSPDRLKKAADFGITQGILKDGMDSLHQHYPSGFGLVVDATGSPAVTENAVKWVRKAGKLLIFGVAPQGSKVSFEPYDLYHREITVYSSMAINHSYPDAVKIARQHSINWDRLVSHQMPFTEYLSAIDLVRRGKAMKIQLVAPKS